MRGVGVVGVGKTFNRPQRPSTSYPFFLSLFFVLFLLPTPPPASNFTAWPCAPRPAWKGEGALIKHNYNKPYTREVGSDLLVCVRVEIY